MNWISIRFSFSTSSQSNGKTPRAEDGGQPSPVSGVAQLRTTLLGCRGRRGSRRRGDVSRVANGRGTVSGGVQGVRCRGGAGRCRVAGERRGRGRSTMRRGTIGRGAGGGKDGRNYEGDGETHYFFNFVRRKGEGLWDERKVARLFIPVLPYSIYF